MYLKHTSFCYIIPFMPSLYRLTFWNIILLVFETPGATTEPDNSSNEYYEVVHILVYLFWDGQCAFCKCTEMNSSNWCYFVPHLKYLLFMTDFTSIQTDWRSRNLKKTFSSVFRTEILHMKTLFHVKWDITIRFILNKRAGILVDVWEKI